MITPEQLPDVVLRMWNLIEEAWLSDNAESGERHSAAITACMDFVHDVPSHEVYEAAQRVPECVSTGKGG